MKTIDVDNVGSWWKRIKLVILENELNAILILACFNLFSLEHLFCSP
jgi:hypothetical protein